MQMTVRLCHGEECGEGVVRPLAVVTLALGRSARRGRPLYRNVQGSESVISDGVYAHAPRVC